MHNGHLLPFFLATGKLMFEDVSKKNPTYSWNIPQTINHLFLKEILPYLYFGGTLGYVDPGSVGIFLECVKSISANGHQSQKKSKPVEFYLRHVHMLYSNAQLC